MAGGDHPLGGTEGHRFGRGDSPPPRGIDDLVDDYDVWGAGEVPPSTLALPPDPEVVKTISEKSGSTVIYPGILARPLSDMLAEERRRSWELAERLNTASENVVEWMADARRVSQERDELARRLRDRDDPDDGLLDAAPWDDADEELQETEGRLHEMEVLFLRFVEVTPRAVEGILRSFIRRIGPVGLLDVGKVADTVRAAVARAARDAGVPTMDALGAAYEGVRGRITGNADKIAALERKLRDTEEDLQRTRGYLREAGERSAQHAQEAATTRAAIWRYLDAERDLRRAVEARPGPATTVLPSSAQGGL